MKQYLEPLMAGTNLERGQAADLLEALASGEVHPAAAGAILAALRLKGETPDEVAGFAEAMRRLARRPQFTTNEPLLDIVGTGGDASSSYNISTGSALLAAACGLRIAKHGNRSISSICGSADVLEALGLPLPLTETDAAACLERTGFTFLFAPHYHPAMAALAPVRKAMGVRTIFNMLGPLTNPARPAFGIIGAFSSDAAGIMAEALSALDIERYFVVHGVDGWDEPSPTGPFLLFDVQRGSVTKHVRDPSQYDVARCHADDLRGGDAACNSQALRAALSGQQNALRDALIISAALALEVSGKAAKPLDAAAIAAQAITQGKATQLLEALRSFGDEVRSRPDAGEPSRG